MLRHSTQADGTGGTGIEGETLTYLRQTVTVIGCRFGGQICMVCAAIRVSQTPPPGSGNGGQDG
jgi:hypothetical protein